MAHIVFISYATEDEAAANRICAALEVRGLTCWIAPQDIDPGDTWPAAIAQAISSSRVLLLVFSNWANSSADVSKEVTAAFEQKIRVVPFRIENVKPRGALAYHLAGVEWVDAFDQTLTIEAHVEKLAPRLREMLSGASVGATSVAEPAPASGRREGRGARGWMVWVGVLGVCVVLALGYVGYVKSRDLPVSGERESSSKVSASPKGADDDGPGRPVSKPADTTARGSPPPLVKWTVPAFCDVSREQQAREILDEAERALGLGYAQQAVERFQCAYLKLPEPLQRRVDQQVIRGAFDKRADLSLEEYRRLAWRLRAAFSGIRDALMASRQSIDLHPSGRTTHLS